MAKTEARTVLVVDDDPHIAEMLQALLAGEGHDVARAKDGLDALAAIERRRPDLILLDLDMPRMSGFDVCLNLKGDPATRLIPVIILTGRDDSELRLRLWDLGADEYLAKPVQPVEVLSRSRSLLRVKDLIDQLDSAESVVFAFARAMDAKSTCTQGHTARVTVYALGLADRIGISASDRHSLHRGAALHDIGKIAIPDDILNKPGRLTNEEFEIIKGHPAAGVRIVEPLQSVRDAVPIIRSHHERMDGRGYPDGLFGGAIPLLARILSVADVFDALSSVRPYRSAIPLAQCGDMLQSSAKDGGLDPELVRVFCQGQTDILSGFVLESKLTPSPDPVPLTHESGVRQWPHPS